MNVNADSELVINNLINQIAKLSRENAVYLAALAESQEKIKELEKEHVE